jgi:hypothetical protein
MKPGKILIYDEFHLNGCGREILCGTLVFTVAFDLIISRWWSDRVLRYSGNGQYGSSGSHGRGLWHSGGQNGGRWPLTGWRKAWKGCCQVWVWRTRFCFWGLKLELWVVVGSLVGYWLVVMVVDDHKWTATPCICTVK